MPLAAQTTTGTITGTVLDAQGAVIPGASVTATNVAQNASTKATTDGIGKFTFTQMLPSTYTIVVQKEGFKTFEQKNVVLTGNNNISVGSIQLEVGAASQRVEIVAQGDQLQTETAQRGTTIVGAQLSNIQNNGRNFLGLLRMVPGMYTNLDTQATSNQTGDMNMNGSRADQSNISINGASDIDTGSNTKLFVTINPDTIQEFTVLSNSYDAQYGKAGGAQINVVTKSGTTSFHGMGYEYFRDRFLNANSWTNNRDHIALPQYHYNTFGYNLGGPVYIPNKFNKEKKKLFFFWSDEYQRQLIPAGVNKVEMPTADMRKGDFSHFIDKTGAVNPYIKDPLLAGNCKASDTTACFQDGGVIGKIPQARLYLPGQALLNWLPLPNTTQTLDYNYVTQNSYSNPRHEQLLRMDYNINDKWRLNGTFANLAQDIVTSDYCPSGYSLCSNFPVTPWTYNHPGHVITTNLSTTINSKTTNEFIWDIGTHPVQILATDPSKVTVAGSGITLPVMYSSAKTLTPQGNWIPNFTFNDGKIANSPVLNKNDGAGSWTPYNGYNTTIEFADNFSRMQGKHFLRFGAFVQRSRKNQPAYNWPSGNYNFGSSSSNPLDTQNGYANALLGVYNTFTQSTAYLQGQYRYTNAEFYAQDSWRLAPRLTLNFGVRAYYVQPQYDQGASTSNFLPSLFNSSQAQHVFKPSTDTGLPGGTNILIDSVTGAVVWTPTMAGSVCNYPAAQAYAICSGKLIPGVGTATNGLVQSGQVPFNNPYLMKVPPIFFAPRFGLAFDVTGHGDFVFRMGAGAFPDRYQGNQIFGMITNPPSTMTTTLYYGQATSINPNNALMAPMNISAIDTNDKIPVVYNWNMGIQAKLPKAFSTDIAYVGSTSRHLINQTNINGIPFGGAFLLANQNPAAGTGGNPGDKAYSSTYIRPIQGYDNINMQNFGGTSNYNALQAQLNRRFSSGLFLSASYVWSKCMDTGDADGTGMPVFPDQSMQREYQYGPCGFDVRQNLTASYVYPLPKFSKILGWSNGVTSRILDGWVVSGVTTFRNGNPTTVNMGLNSGSVTNFTGTGSQIGTLRAVQVGNPLTGTSSDPYNRINVAAYAMQPLPTTTAGANCPTFGCVTSFTYGLGQERNQIITPGVNNFDLTLQKNIVIKEGKQLQLRLEGFNAFNHTQFSGLNSTINYTSPTNSTVSNLTYNSSGALVKTNGFGSVSGVRTPRVVQLSAKFVF
jgi:hypothetical protein